MHLTLASGPGLGLTLAPRRHQTRSSSSAAASFSGREAAMGRSGTQAPSSRAPPSGSLRRAACRTRAAAGDSYGGGAAQESEEDAYVPAVVDSGLSSWRWSEGNLCDLPNGRIGGERTRDNDMAPSLPLSWAVVHLSLVMARFTQLAPLPRPSALK